MNCKGENFVDIKELAFDTIKQLCLEFGLINEEGEVMVTINDRIMFIKEFSAFDGENYRQVSNDQETVEFCKQLLKLYDIALKYTNSNNSVNKRVLAYQQKK